MVNPGTRTEHWLTHELDEGRRREAHHERASLARERRVMAARRREAQAPGVGITVVLAFWAFVGGIVTALLTPPPTSATFVGGALVLAGGLVLVRVGWLRWRWRW